MNTDLAYEMYPYGTKIVFQSISSKIAEKLFRFAVDHEYGETLTINGVKYRLDFVSYHGRFNSVSMYFIARNRLYRISDHWSFIGSRGQSKAGNGLTSCSTFGKGGNNWTLKGPDQSVLISDKIIRYYWTDSYGKTSKYTWQNRRVEGGYVEWRRIEVK